MSIAEQYEDFLLSLEEKGVPNPRLLVPVTAALVIIIIGFFALQGGLPAGVPGGGGGKKSITLYVKDYSTGAGVYGAVVEIGGKRSVTDASGKVDFADLPESATTVSVTASNYETVSGTALPASGGTIKLSPASTAPDTFKVIVQVRDAEDNDVSDAFVSILDVNGATLGTATTNAFGEATLNLDPTSVPASATVKVAKDGFKTATLSVSRSEMEVQSVNIVLELPTETGLANANEGTLKVFVTDIDGNAVESATVAILDYYTDAIIRTGRSAADGSASFDKIAYGKKIVFSVKQTAFNDYLSDSQDFSKDNTEFYASLTKKTVADPNALNVQVADASGAAIGGATLKVYDRSTRTLLSMQTTDDSGAATVSVQRGKALFVTAYAAGFLPGFSEVAQAGDSIKISLDSEAVGNFIDVPVTVKQDGEPAPNALVAFYRADGFPLGVPDSATDADGVATFRLPLNIKGGQYEAYASASLDALHGKSDLSLIVEGAEFFVSLQPDPAVLRVEVRDVSTNETVSGAAVTLKPSTGDVRSCVAEQGKNYCEFSVAPNQEFFLTAEADGYLPATTASFVLDPSERSATTILVYPETLARGASVRFEGVFDAKDRSVQELQNTAFYEARFLVTIPKSADQSYFFVSVGSAASVDDDVAGIVSFDSDSVKAVYSGASDSDSCAGSEYSNDSQSLDGLMKWVNIALPTNFVGTKEFAFKIFVKPEAKAGSKIAFHSRVSGVSKLAPFLYPTSEDQLNALLQKTTVGTTLAASDFCSLDARTDSVKVSKNLLYCQEGLCQQLVFEDDSGAQSQDALSTQIGKEFLLSYVFASEDKEITAVGVKAGEAIKFLGKETVELNMSSGATLDFASTSASTADQQRFPASAQPGERVTGLLRFKTVKSSSFAPITLTVYYAESSEQPTPVQVGVTVTGSDVFKADLQPASLVAGLAENVRLTLRDSFGSDVEDANVLFYECDGSPLNGQETQLQGDGSTNKGADGVYRTKIQPATVGTIGVRVSRDGFQTLDECGIDVAAGEFLSVEPDTLTIKGDSSTPDNLTKELTIYSTLPVRTKVSASVSCVQRGAGAGVVAGPSEVAQLVYVAPQSFYLKDSAKVQVFAQTNASGDADCTLLFHGEVNTKNSFDAVALVQASLTTPAVISYCPLDEGYKCLQASNAPANCYPQTQFECKGAGTATGVATTIPAGAMCFVCDYGMHTLPDSFALTVGETKSSDSKSEDIALDSKPTCAIEGFDETPNQLSSSQYNSLYGGTSSDYWNYQPNQYGAQSPWGGSYSPYSYQNYYGAGYGTGAAGAAGAGYGTGYGTSTGYGTGYSTSGGVSFGLGYGAGYGYGAGSGTYGGYGTGAAGTYCPSTLNTQSMYSGYYSSSYQSPWSTSYPAGNTQSCQYPYICQSGASSSCSFSASGSSYGGAFGYGSSYSSSSACEYPAICYTPSACPALAGYSSGSVSFTPNTFQYAQSKPPVSVTVTKCTAFALQVTAQYTGNDYFYNGAMGGEQNGFLVVTWRGEEQRIPVKVTVKAPSQLMRYPQTPIPYSATMPTTCLPGVQTGKQIEGLDEYGLPTDVTVKVNSFTGAGQYDRKISLAAGVLCKEFKTEEKVTPSDVKCSGTQLAFKLQYPESKRVDLSDTGSFKAYVTGTTSPREYSFDVTNDDLVPEGKIFLYADKLYKESEALDYLEKAKCTASGLAGLKVSCKDNVLNVSWDGITAGKATVKITNASDYNVREIPVEAKKEKHLALENIAAVYYKNAEKPAESKLTFAGLNNIPTEDLSTTSFSVFTDSECKNAYSYSGDTVFTFDKKTKADEKSVTIELKDAKINDVSLQASAKSDSKLDFSTALSEPKEPSATGTETTQETTAGSKDYWFKVTAKAPDKDSKDAKATKTMATACTPVTARAAVATTPVTPVTETGSGKTCKNDEDCGTGEKCEGGKCVAKTPVTTPFGRR